jgi:GR25 family glycosyltransferase involved in LPS biosynthesis
MKYVLNRDMNLGEIACAAGHQIIAENFRKTAQEWALVLEDDAILQNDITQVLARLPKVNQPTIVNLAGIHNSRITPNLKVDTRGPKYFSFKTSKVLTTVSLSHGYLMNKSAAHLIHKYNRKINSTSDFPFNYRSLVDFYISQEIYFDAPGGTSLIWPDSEVTFLNFVQKSNFYFLKNIKSHNMKRIRRRLLQAIEFFYFISGIGFIYPLIIGLPFKCLWREKIIWPCLLFKAQLRSCSE